MSSIYTNIISALNRGQKLLAVLIDPDKTEVNNVKNLCAKINASVVTHILVGGSEVKDSQTEKIVVEIKKYSKLPLILFPGDITQISNSADGILFLSLISGRNPDYLIGKHVEAISKLRDSSLEIMPTGYILIEGGSDTAVERVSKTQPITSANIETIVDTAVAGELLGLRLIYLEAGSGANNAVDPKVICQTKKQIHIPLIVGGGIRSKAQIENAYNAGADIVVIGTAFENNNQFFNDLQIKL